MAQEEPDDAEMFLREMEDPELARSAPTVGEDPLEVRNPELEAEHAAALDDLGGAAEPPDATDTEALKLDHASVLDGLSSALSPREPSVDAVKDVAAIPRGASTPPATERTKRFYVPPRQRTPENRAERRQAVEQTTRHQEANQPSDFPDLGDEGGGEEAGGGMQRFIEMSTRTTEGLSSALIDAIRRLELVEQLLERERL